MTGEFFFKLLNPAIALVFTATFLMLWRRRRTYRYPLLLALAFFMSGLGFAANDFLAAYDGNALRIFANGCFLVSVLAICISAFIRIDAPVPTVFFAVLCTIGMASFAWFLFVEPSTYARIFIVNGTFALLAGVTTWMQVQIKPKTGVDWLFICLAGSILVQAVARPAAVLLQGLDINSNGPLRDSEYWATVQALTPLLALILALSFLIAFAVQVFNELREEADQDYLSGLLNRRGFDMQAKAALAASPAKQWPSAVMIADIDNFKLINDTFGHPVGDQVIAAIARILATRSQADIVGRTGGEEFGLYYDEARRSELLSDAAAIRDEISILSVDPIPRGYPITVSIGIHHRHQSQTLPEMMREADRALYAAKTAGKDQAVMTPLKLHPVQRLGSSSA